MPEFIGSTGMLNPNQCQNDVYIIHQGDQPDPASPSHGDTRLIVQCTSKNDAYIYSEVYNNGAGPGANAFHGWEVASIPWSLDMTVNGQGVQFTRLITNRITTQQFRPDNNEIWGWFFRWDAEVKISVKNNQQQFRTVRLQYIPHAHRPAKSNIKHQQPAPPPPPGGRIRKRRTLTALGWTITATQNRYGVDA